MEKLAALNKLTACQARLQPDVRGAATAKTEIYPETPRGRADDMLDCWLIKALSANCR
jgi:hypothetical protein